MTDKTHNNVNPGDQQLDQLPLGKHAEYVDQYSPQLLCPIPRRISRSSLGLNAQSLPFTGVDIWNAYELSWLNARGKPQVAMAQFYFLSDSDAIVESKSFKLYLNSFNQTCVSSAQALQHMLATDLTQASGAPVVVKLLPPMQWQRETLSPLAGYCLDDLDIAIDQYQPRASVLRVDHKRGAVTREQLFSHLFRSLCPVTGQPDWGSVSVCYTGPAIDHASLLTYLVGFRQHQDFHEQCVERVFLDILARCEPSELTVSAHFVRRGGVDINPYRSTDAANIPSGDSAEQAHVRLARQ